MNTPPSATGGAESLRKTSESWSKWAVQWVPNVLLVAVGLYLIGSEFRRTLPGDGLFDFGSFVASGQAAAKGLNPYGIYPPLTFHLVMPGFDTWNQNLNPPISALLFQLFGLAEPHRMFHIWYGVTAVLYAVTIGLLVWRYRAAPPLIFVIWACSLGGFWETLALGQIYVPLVLATVMAWLLLERRFEWGAGILIGIVVAIKPNFAVWPVLLFLSGYRRSALVSLGTAVTISAIPAAVFGVEVYRQWFALIASDSARAVFVTNVALSGLAARAGSPVVGNALSLVLLLGAAWWAWSRRRPVTDVSAIALVVSLLAAPVAWVHYTLFLLPVLCVKWRVPGIRVVAGALMVTIAFVSRWIGAPPVVQLTLGSIYGWSVILLLIALLFDDLRNRNVPRDPDPVAPPADI